MLALPGLCLAQLVPRHTRHAPDDLIRGGEARRAVGERGGHVLRVRGQDVERAIALEDDAGVAPRRRTAPASSRSPPDSLTRRMVTSPFTPGRSILPYRRWPSRS